MYFPHLRGTPQVLDAIREADFLSDLVVPVLAPTDLSPASVEAYRDLADHGRRFAMVANSGHGAPAPTTAGGMDAIDEIEARAPGVVLPALEVRAQTDRRQVQHFATRFASRRCVVVHRSHFHDLADMTSDLSPLGGPAVQVFLDGGAPLSVARELPALGRVLLRDGLAQVPPDGACPPRTSFGDLAQTFDELGYDGFGDFATEGDRPGDPGSTCLTLRLTEEIGGRVIVTNHFVASTDGDERSGYFGALELLVARTGRPPAGAFDTMGVRAYHDSLEREHVADSAERARWSLLHHLELMDRKLAELGRARFV